MSGLNNESTEERIYRQNILGNNIKKATPIVIILGVIVLGLLSFMSIAGNNVEAYGEGNQYECKECNKLGFACKEHRGFDTEAALKEKINKFAMGYIPNGQKSTYLLYGENNEYNLDCDFCVEEGSECYGCEYNRIAIEEAAESAYDNGILESRLCSKDWKLGYADCNADRLILSQMIYGQIEKED